MSQHCRRLLTAYTLNIVAVAVFGTLSAQAATLGHSRVISLPDQPLQITVKLKDLSPAELKNLSVQIAPAQAWQEFGLTPPVALATMRTQLTPGTQSDSMLLTLMSSESAVGQVLDVLVDITSDVSTQRHQVSVLQTKTATPVALAQSRKLSSSVTMATTVPVTESLPEPKTVPTASNNNVSQVQVKAGQNLHGIARQFGHDQYNDQQMMAALFNANPQAFIHGNMNLLRAGATLQIPDAVTIDASSPQQARQLYQTHLAWFDTYRQRVAKGQSITPMGQSVTKVEGAFDISADRLELSTQSDTDTKADQAMVTAQELAHTAQRLAQVEGGQGTAEAQVVTTEPTTDNSAAIQLPSTLVSNMAATAAAANQDALDSTSSKVDNPPPSWLQNNWLLSAFGLLGLVALLVTWFLRRNHSNKMEYAEAVPYNSNRVREKFDKTNSDLTAPTTDEVEFREIK